MDFSLERRYASKGFSVVGGVDEVGRGAVAGPLFVAVAIFENFCGGCDIFWTDSKKINGENTRRKVFMKLLDIPDFYWSVGWVEAWEIDEKGIMWGLGEALDRALNKIREEKKPTILLVDGKLPFTGVSTVQRPIVKGDSISPSIAAASVVAKVIRDIYVASLSELIPYGVMTNKGYGTKYHLEKIQEEGITIWHRKTFLSKYLKEGERK